MQKSLSFALTLAMASTVSAATPGEPDGSFGTGGRVLTRLSTSELYYDSASALVFRNGRAPLVIGTLRDNSSGPSFAMAALNEQGQPDATFSTQGASAVALPWTKSQSAVTLSDGSFVTLLHQYRGFMLAKFLPNGDLDHRFGIAGTSSTVVTEESVMRGMQPLGLASDREQRWLVWGFAPLGGQQKLFVTAFHGNGLVDRSFGYDGVRFDAPMASALLVPNQATLLLAGIADTRSLVVQRYRRQGLPDATFGENGRLVLPVPGLEALDLGQFVRDERGGFFAAGSGKSTASGQRVFFAARFGADGRLDEHFGNKGFTAVSFDGGLEPLLGAKIVVDREHRPILFGTLVNRRHPDPSTARAIGIARLSTSGSLDRTFGRDGRSTVVERSSFLRAGALDQAGRLVVVGQKSLDEAPFTTAWLTRRFRLE